MVWMAFRIRDNHERGRALNLFHPDAVAALGLIKLIPTSELREIEEHQGHAE